MPSRLDLILSLSAFRDAFAVLKSVDAENGAAIEKAIRNAVDEAHRGIRDATGSPDRIRYWLFRSAVELKAQSSGFLSYEREMAQRQGTLWRFALENNEALMHFIFDELDKCFSNKADSIISEVERDARWYTGLRDHVKQAGLVPKKAGELVRRGLDALKKRQRLGKRVRSAISKVDSVVGEVAALDVRGIVAKAIEIHLSAAILGKDLQKILSDAMGRYEKAWTEQIHTQSPDLRELRAFAGVSLGHPQLSAALEVGVAEQTFAVGFGGAIVGTLTLASGWHALAYAMVYVFWPVAVTTALATIGVAVWRKEKDLEGRRQRVREIVYECQKHLIVQIDTGRFAELGDKTLRDTVSERAKELVEATVRIWERAISGNLNGQHYRLLDAAFAAHLQLIQECTDDLPDTG